MNIPNTRPSNTENRPNNEARPNNENRPAEPRGEGRRGGGGNNNERGGGRKGPDRTEKKDK